jgi:hypothetical protein
MEIMALKKEETTWKLEAEASIGRVQRAGNALEDRVGKMGEEIGKK